MPDLPKQSELSTTNPRFRPPICGGSSLFFVSQILRSGLRGGMGSTRHASFGVTKVLLHRHFDVHGRLGLGCGVWAS